MRIIWLKWEDSHTYPGSWSDVGMISDPNPMEAIGFEVRSTEKSITISVCANKDGDEFACPLTITRSSIVEGPYEVEFRK